MKFKLNLKDKPKIYKIHNMSLISLLTLEIYSLSNTHNTSFRQYMECAIWSVHSIGTFDRLRKLKVNYNIFRSRVNGAGNKLPIGAIIIE